jgi:XRE family transcriptional regulator, aerobic/anaerobic benzoate catabolism transcriptional regulator
MTARDLAERAGVSLRLVAAIEAADANPTVASLSCIAAALGADVSALLVVAARRSIVLVGMRGAGKSTVGKQLADRLQRPFIELDRVVETQTGLSLQALFEIHGVDGYRQLEGQAIDETLEGAPSVIAPGGGIVTDSLSWKLLRARSWTVWLKASPQEHWDRVRAQGDDRPMAQRTAARAELDVIWHARQHLYAQAHCAVVTSGRAVDAVVDEIALSYGTTDTGAERST